jgi:hypothetical protein
MNERLSEEQLTGYTHGTLTDAEREAIDRHLSACSGDRARLTAVEDAARQLRNGLAAEMTQIQPPEDLAFAAVAGRVKAPGRMAGLWQRGLPFASAGLALLGVIVAMGGLVGTGILQKTFLALKEVGQVESIAAQVRYPLAACFLLAVPLAANRDYEYTFQPGRLAYAALVFLLWLGSAVVALYEIYLIQGVVIYLGIVLSAVNWLSVLGAFTPFLLGMVWIGLVIGGGELHYRRFGTPASWKLFAWTLGIEMLILPLTLLV